MFPLWYSSIYTNGLDPECTFPRTRYQEVRSRLESKEAITFREPTPSPITNIKLAHDANYVDDFLTGNLDDKAVRRIGLRPWTEVIVERTLILTHGTVSATRHVLESGGFAGNLGGGTHHAYFDFGSGYCIFNDLAVSALVARRDYGIRRVLILDLDVHQGDGTAAIFEGDPDIRTVSFHCGKNFPFRKMTSDLDVEFDPGTEDDEYLSTLEQFLERDAAVFEPELILFQGGVDGLKADKLGHLALSRKGLGTRNELVLAFARENRLPLTLTMGGGYGEPLSASVESHSDLFLQAAEHRAEASAPTQSR